MKNKAKLFLKANKIHQRLKKQLKKNQSPNKPFYYLETSVQVKRILGHFSHRKLIENLLKDGEIYSSYFILKEFKQTILLPLIQFYFILKEEDCLEDAVKVFADQTYSIRDAKEIVTLLGQLCLENDLKDNKEKALFYIRSYIYNLNTLFNALIKGFVNDISAFTNNKVTLEMSDEGFRKFVDDIKCKGICGQERFWDSHVEVLELFLNERKNEKHKALTGFFNLIPLFQEILANRKRADLFTRCSKLGDSIIAIECPRNMRLVSLDQAFSAYCSLLDKRFLLIPSLVGIRKGELPKRG